MWFISCPFKSHKKWFNSRTLKVIMLNDLSCRSISLVPSLPWAGLLHLTGDNIRVMMQSVAFGWVYLLSVTHHFHTPPQIQLDTCITNLKCAPWKSWCHTSSWQVKCGKFQNFISKSTHDNVVNSPLKYIIALAVNYIIFQHQYWQRLLVPDLEAECKPDIGGPGGSADGHSVV